MASVITKIDKSSPLHHRAHPGDRLVSINGKEIEDVLDYKYFCYDTRLTVELEDEDGHRRLVKIKKPEGGELPVVPYDVRPLKKYSEDNARDEAEAQFKIHRIRYAFQMEEDLIKVHPVHLRRSSSLR